MDLAGLRLFFEAQTLELQPQLPLLSLGPIETDQGAANSEYVPNVPQNIFSNPIKFPASLY